MTLCDTGPLVALIDRDDEHHMRCLAALAVLPAGGLLTTWPCFTEAMYLLGRAAGLEGQDALWDWVVDGLLRLLPPEPRDIERMRVLMRRYGDAPMDLADASLVVAAERLGERRIFTLDGHFRAYRIQERNAFKIVPGPA